LTHYSQILSSSAITKQFCISGYWQMFLGIDANGFVIKFL